MAGSEPVSESPASQVWLARHGETEWSRDGKHTSTTDLPLTDDGVRAAEALADRLSGETFALVLTSPMSRARETARLAGFPDAEVCEDLMEWRYGDYEGVTTPEIRTSVPGWTVWSHEMPGGETAQEIGDRIDRVIARLREVDGPSLVFGHGHSLRVLTARWLDQEVADGRHFKLDTATVSVLGWERDDPALLSWNS